MCKYILESKEVQLREQSGPAVLSDTFTLQEFFALETIAMSVEKYDEHDNQSFDSSTAVYTLNSEAEKRLIRKIDLRIVCAFFLAQSLFSFIKLISLYRYPLFLFCTLSLILIVPT